MADDNERHSVLIVGIDGIPGGAAAASTRLEQKFRLPRPVAEKLVASIPAVVKKDVTMDDAQRYAAAIHSIGADARIVPYSANKKEKAGVTGVLKQRGPQPAMSESKRGDLVPTSGGYMSVTKKRGTDNELAERDEGTAAGGIVPAGASAALRDVEPEDHPSAESSPIGTANTIMGTAFDPAAFALPAALNSGTPADGAMTNPDLFEDVDAGGGAIAGTIGTATDEFGAADTEFAGAEVSEGNRPSLFDELMSMDDSGIGMSPDRGDFGMSQSGEAAARKLPDPRPSLSESNPTREFADSQTTSSAAGPTGFDQFGNLELGGDPSESGLNLQLDTNKPHLTGSFAAVSDSGASDSSRSDKSGEFDLPPPPPKAKGTVLLSALTDPLEEEIERTLRESQPVERTRTLEAGFLSAKNATGGFSATAERHRNSNSRFARVIGWLILLIILAGGAGAGFVFYERWAATLEAKNFAEAPNYFEHTTRFATSADGHANFVRGCAQPDPTVPTFSCRYSREFYQTEFPEIDSAIQTAAASQCYGTLFDDGQSSAEILDCKVSVTRAEGTVSARFYAAFHRECEISLVMMESGDTTQCTFSEVVELLAADAATPSGERVTVQVEYKRRFELDTDAGGLASREYLFSHTDRSAEYHYFSESVGLFVRAAELGGAATLRLTFADRGGNTAGHQAWPR